MPLIFNEHISHCEVKIDGAFAVSAGFINTSNHKVYGKSDSLGLSPHSEDEHYLSLSLIGMGTSCFVDNFNIYKS